MITYVLREDVAYGIDVLDEKGEVIQTMKAVHTDKKTIEELVKLCNSEELNLIHLNDVVEDLIT